MSRGRISVAGHIPPSGRSVAAANLILTWDPEATLGEKEEAVRDACTQALSRLRDIEAGRSKACQVSG